MLKSKKQLVNLTMTWKKKLKKYNTKDIESTIKKLKNKNKVNDEFLTCLSQLTLEEVIAVKLELATIAAGGMLFGLPIWNSMPDIIKEAVLKGTLAACKTKTDAAAFLGINRARLSNLIKKYDLTKNDN